MFYPNIPDHHMLAFTHLIRSKAGYQGLIRHGVLAWRCDQTPQKCCESYILRQQKKRNSQIWYCSCFRNPANPFDIHPRWLFGILPTVSRISAPSTVVFHPGIHSLNPRAMHRHWLSLKPPLNPSSFFVDLTRFHGSMVPWLWVFSSVHAERKNAKELSIPIPSKRSRV